MWEYSNIKKVGDVYFYLINQGHNEALDENNGVDHVSHHHVYVEVDLERLTSDSEEDSGYSEEDYDDSRSTDMSGPTNDDMSNPIKSESGNMTLDDIVELCRAPDISLGFWGPVYEVCGSSNPVIGEDKEKNKEKGKGKQKQKENVQKIKGEQAKALIKKRLRPSDLPEEELDELPTIYDSDGDIIITEEDKVDETPEIGITFTVGETSQVPNSVGANPEIDPNNLQVEEGYYSTHTSQDGNDGPTQEDIDRVDEELIYFARDTENIFSVEESKVLRKDHVQQYDELNCLGCCGTKGLIEVVGEIFPNANHRYCFRHMYKNMKKCHKVTHLEMLIRGAAKSFKESDKKKFLNELLLTDPAAYEWLHREPYEYWAMSHLDFSLKCEHITNNLNA
ncbi:hypothetical protein GIB67_014002 [Kingdonia uniflora]|uniref:Transposase MuDR plant domain-containing protein n=1 Tax=Kingdonia uniflora TaxID=39325 RepID=A0A7J7L5L7_9MAGN|nr:hypothetical protein GIB67_014002 [Kingdonia uniflora]